MVDALHAAGLEVLLDVVFNHTAEADQLGPTLCFRGLDNPAYYRLDADDPQPLRRHDRLRQLAERRRSGDAAADHGLAAVLADRRCTSTASASTWPPRSAARTAASSRCRRSSTWSRRTRWCRRAKLIAEPWDVGQFDSYDLGRFPPLWREWNGKYRDTMRDFWRSHPVGLGEFATRFCGSSDLYAGARRRPRRR